MGRMKVNELIENHDQRVRTFMQPLCLSDLAYDVERAIPGCRVTPTSNQVSAVYMPDDVYPMGYIGWGAFYRSKSSFMVQSPHIENKTYQSGGDNRRRKFTSKREQAVKLAKKFLRRQTLAEMIPTTLSDYKEQYNTARGEVRTEAYGLVSKLFGHTSLHALKKSAVFAELRALAATGHEFLNPEIGEAMANLIPAVEGIEAEDRRERHVYAVHTYERGGQQLWDVMPINNVNGWSPRPYYDGLHQYRADDIPEDIMGKVAVLSMLEDGTLLMDVGMKFDARLFYVAR